MFYDGLPLEFFPILIHRYNSFNRQLKWLYCLILDGFNISFKLNFTVSSLRRNSDLYFQFSKRIFATHFINTWSASLYYLFVDIVSSPTSYSGYRVGFLSHGSSVRSPWRQLIFYSLSIFQDWFWLFSGSFWISKGIFLQGNW